MGVKGVASDKTEYGPSWRDCYTVWAEIEKEGACVLELRGQLCRAATGERGLRVVLTTAASGLVLASAGFGPACASSGRTFPAALFGMLMEVVEVEGERKGSAFPSTLLRVDQFFRRG